MRKIVSGAAAIAAAVLLVAACNSDDYHGANGPSSGTGNGPSSGTASVYSGGPSSEPIKFSSQTPSDGVWRITVAELKAAVEKNQVFIVDVRAPEYYAQDHIKGAVNIPEPSTESRIGEFPRNKLIVAYCS